jgi:hypothetical protein
MNKALNEMIQLEAKEFAKKDGTVPDVILSSTEYSLSALVGYHAGATSMAKEVENAMKFSANGFQLLTYGGDDWIENATGNIYTTSELFGEYLKLKEK